MTAGIQPNLGTINQQAGQIVLNARSAIQQILFFNDYLQDLGSAGLSALGMDQDDADLLITIYVNLAAVANMCLGEEYTGPALPFNFLAQSIPLWGGM